MKVLGDLQVSGSSGDIHVTSRLTVADTPTMVSGSWTETGMSAAVTPPTSGYGIYVIAKITALFNNDMVLEFRLLENGIVKDSCIEHELATKPTTTTLVYYLPNATANTLYTYTVSGITNSGATTATINPSGWTLTPQSVLEVDMRKL